MHVIHFHERDCLLGMRAIAVETDDHMLQVKGGEHAYLGLFSIFSALVDSRVQMMNCAGNYPQNIACKHEIFTVLR